MPEDAPKEEEKKFDWADAAGPAYSELHGTNPTQLEGIDDAIEEDGRRYKLAQQIWNEGAALDYICASCSLMHVGDTAAIKCMIISYACTRVTNCHGLHVSLSGPAGSGKSHVGETVVKHLPEGVVMDSRVSDKALFYHKINPKTPILLDDQDLTEDVQELLKRATTQWDVPVKYKTVQNQKALELELPTRSPFWVLKANLVGDEQVLDRQVMFWTDDSYEQKKAISDMILASAALEEVQPPEFPAVSRYIWANIPDENMVRIPYAKRINTSQVEDARIIHMLISLIQGIALMKGPARQVPMGYNEDGTPKTPLIVESEEEDFYEAIAILNPLLQNHGGSQKLKLSKGANEVLEYLRTTYHEGRTVPFDEIRRGCQMDMRQLSYALNGRNDNQTDGLLGVCPAVEIVDIAKSDETIRGTTRRRAVQWSPDVFRGWWASIGIFTLDEE